MIAELWDQHPVLTVLGLWLIACAVISLSSGWFQLAREYRAQKQFTGKRWWFQSASMGLASFNGVLALGANQHGVHVSILPMFRFLHAPLFFPWSDIEVAFESKWWMQVAVLRFARGGSAGLSISEGLFLKLRAEQSAEQERPCPH